MIHNIYENNKSSKTSTALKATLSTVKSIVDNGHNSNEKCNVVVTTNNNNNNNNNNRNGGGNVQTSYGHGIWYSEIIDGANNAIAHKQQNIDNFNSNNNKDNIINRNACSTTNRREEQKHQQQTQTQKYQTTCTQTNNECDIIIVDLEGDDDEDADADVDNGTNRNNNNNNNNNNEVEQQNQLKYHQHQPTKYSLAAKFFMNANKKFSQKHPTTCVKERAKNNITCSVNNNVPHIAIDATSNNEDNVQEEDEDDSLASMETLSDNVSIWIEGEKHWVAGVDSNTTCSQLIWALLSYQNGQRSYSQQQPKEQQEQEKPFNFLSKQLSASNEESIVEQTNDNQFEEHELQKQLQQQQQQLPKLYDKNVSEFNLKMCTKEGSNNMCSGGNQPNIQFTPKTNNNFPYNNNSNCITKPSTFIPSTYQSMPIHTKENCKIIQNPTLAATTTATFTASLAATPIISSLAHVSDITPPLTLLPLMLPAGIATVSQLATEYVIVKQYHHCEEYLDGSTKVFDVLTPRNGSNKKECELLLRHLGPAPAVYINNATPQLSSLISTDKDSGMGSPVGSARSAKFRRRKHKSSQWLAQANTLHPKLSRCSANERLMKIILTQDETIQRQLSLLREKERQITKIEEEKHRKRERELGKNYLLETYLNGLDEAECEPEIQDTVEIFIDEPCERAVATTTITTTTVTSASNPRTAITASAVTLAAGTITDKKPLTTQPLNLMARHKLKEKEVKREKKKKRHKEKPTKGDDEIDSKDLNMKTNKNRDKEKVQKQQNCHQELKSIEENNTNDNKDEGKQEIEIQILWLEKIYTLNKQLQKEEELAAKLHAKVRKHQLKKAQQTQQEVQLEIDKLDNNLALQCGDIRKVEANLMQTNEQLQKKLLILERLSIEYLQEQQEKEVYNNRDHIKAAKDTDNILENDTNTLLTNLQKSLDVQKFSLNNIKSQEEVIKLEKIIAKSSTDVQRTSNAELIEMKQEPNASVQNALNILSGESAKSTILQPTNQRFSILNSMPKNHCVIFPANHHLQEQQQLHHHHHHHNDQQQQEQVIPLMTSIPVTGQTSHIEETMSNTAVSTSCMVIDKNMLSSLHVQNAKTIKKQMFHTQTTTATATATATTTASQILPPKKPSPPFVPQTAAFSVPKLQFQHTQQQFMPTASTFLTSRPQNSHQIQATNIAVVQQPSTATSSCACPHLTATPAPAPAPAPASLLMAQQHQHPPASASPSPSIMAMNTVDISQLGTLV